MEFIQRIKEFFRYIKNEKIGLFYHNDGDGICSAVIAAKAIERLRGEEPELISYSGQRLKHIARFAKRENITKLISVDLTLDQHEDQIKEIEEFADLLIIDHHTFHKDINSDKTILIKPELFGEKGGGRNPACKLVYNFLSEIVDLSDLDWVAAMGIISDAGYDSNKEFVDNVLKKYNYEMKENIFKTKLGEASVLIGYTCAVREVEECREVLTNSKTPEEFLGSKLKKYKDEVEKEVNYFIDNFKKLAEFKNDVVFYLLTNKYRSKGIIANKLGFANPHLTLFVFEEHNEGYAISVRREDGKVKLNEIMEKVIVNLNKAFGGGHIMAAGAFIQKKDLDKFKKRVLELLSEK